METRWAHRTSGDFRELRRETKNVCVIPMAIYNGHDPIGCNERTGKALRIDTERLANAINLYKEDSLLWEVHQQRQRGRK